MLCGNLGRRIAFYSTSLRLKWYAHIVSPQGGGKLAHMAGLLGLVEVWVFIVYVIGEAAHFTSAEHVSVKIPDIYPAQCTVWRYQHVG